MKPHCLNNCHGARSFHAPQEESYGWASCSGQEHPSHRPPRSTRYKSCTPRAQEVFCSDSRDTPAVSLAPLRQSSPRFQEIEPCAEGRSSSLRCNDERFPQRATVRTGAHVALQARRWIASLLGAEKGEKSIHGLLAPSATNPGACSSSAHQRVQKFPAEKFVQSTHRVSWRPSAYDIERIIKRRKKSNTSSLNAGPNQSFARLPFSAGKFSID